MLANSEGLAVLTASPARRGFATGMLVNTFGSGLFLTLSAIYVTQVKGVDLGVYSAVLVSAGLAGMLVGPLVGHLADRVDTRKLYVLLLIVQCGGALLLLGDSPEQLMSGVAVVLIGERGAAVARATLIAHIVGRKERVGFRAMIRSIVNVSAAAGAGLGAVVLSADDQRAFEWAIAFDASTFIITALVVGVSTRGLGTRGPRLGTTLRIPRFGRAVRDGRFVSAALLHAVLGLHTALLAVGLPLWISSATNAPLWSVSAVIVFNTVCVVLFQYTAGRRVPDVRAAFNAGGIIGVALASCSAILAVTDSAGPGVTLLLLAAAAAAHVVGELFHSASGWAISYDMAPDGAIGQYQGVFSSLTDLVASFAPLVMTFIVADPGGSRWLILAVVFLLSGSALAILGKADRARG